MILLPNVVGIKLILPMWALAQLLMANGVNVLMASMEGSVNSICGRVQLRQFRWCQSFNHDDIEVVDCFNPHFHA